MNRPCIHCVPLMQREIAVDSEEWYQQVQIWTARLLSREPVVPVGQYFTWSRAGQQAAATAYLFDAAMCNIQYAQYQLQKAASSTGRQAYKAALSAASSYAFVMKEILPKWTFQPVLDIPDYTMQDVYGHYCLARATAYHAVGTADLQCSDAACQAAAGNAAHMFMMAAHLIEGDNHAWIDRAQENVARALVLRGEVYLKAWDEGEDDGTGACKALACFQEADSRYKSIGQAGVEGKVVFAYERNQVHWMPPQLPPFDEMVRPRVTELPSAS